MADSSEETRTEKRLLAATMAIAIVVAIGVGVWLLLFNDDDSETSSSTTTVAAGSGSGSVDESGSGESGSGGSGSGGSDGSGSGSGGAGGGEPGSGSAAGAVDGESCGDVALASGTRDGVFAISQKSSDCSTAKSVATAAGQKMAKNSFPANMSVNGFTCTAVPQDTTQGFAADVTCKNGASTISFNRRFE